jgi:hypothetical protein
MHDDTLGDVYELSAVGGGVVVRCRRASGALDELCRVGPRRRGPDRTALAGAILGDALAATPSRKLIRDYSRFLPVPSTDGVTIPATDVAAWLATWEPPLAALFRRVP